MNQKSRNEGKKAVQCLSEESGIQCVQCRPDKSAAGASGNLRQVGGTVRRKAARSGWRDILFPGARRDD